MTSRTTQIESYVNQYFATWEISLPRDAIASREAGHLFKAGWHIGFLWGEEDGELFLELLSQHRMTSDSHARVFESGRVEELACPASFVIFPVGSTKEERDRIQATAAEETKQAYARLREKGLLPPVGENLPAHDINEYLRSGGEVDEV